MRKRSKYKPRAIIPDTMRFVQLGIGKVADTGDAIMILRLKNHGALTDIVRGNAKKEDVDIIIAAMNVADALARQGIGEAHKEDIRAGQDAIYQMARRGLTLGRFVFTAPEMTAVNFAMEIHEAQLSEITVAQLDAAVALVKRIVIGGGARKIAA